MGRAACRRPTYPRQSEEATRQDRAAVSKLLHNNELGKEVSFAYPLRRCTQGSSKGVEST